MNPMQLMELLRQGGSPKQIVKTMFGKTMCQNPMGQNLMNLAEQGKGAEIEQIARNLCAAKGMDFDKEFKSFKDQMGLK